MTSKSSLSGGLADWRDYPLAASPPHVAGYREKYWACGYDGSSGIGFSIWLETSATDYSSWQEYLHVVVPAGVLVSITTSSRVAEQGPGGQHGSAVCVSPFEHWRYSIRSPMELVPPDELAHRVEILPWRPQQNAVSVQLDLDVVSTAAAWDLSPDAEASSAMAFTTQYRQMFRAEGRLRVGDGAPTSIAARGFRAHSSGPYRGVEFGGHSMMSVEFEDGTAAGYLQHVRPNGTLLFSAGFVIDGGERHDATVVRTQTTLPRLSPGGERFEVCLRTLTRDYLFDVDILVNMSSLRPDYFTETARTEEDRVRAEGITDGLANAMSFAKVMRDGEIAFGVIERSSRIGLLVT